MSHCEPGKAVLRESWSRSSLPTTFLCDFRQEDLMTCPEGSPVFLRFSRLCGREVRGRLNGDGRGHFPT